MAMGNGVFLGFIKSGKLPSKSAKSAQVFWDRVSLQHLGVIPGVKFEWFAFRKPADTEGFIRALEPAN